MIRWIRLIMWNFRVEPRCYTSTKYEFCRLNSNYSNSRSVSYWYTRTLAWYPQFRSICNRSRVWYFQCISTLQLDVYHRSFPPFRHYHQSSCIYVLQFHIYLCKQNRRVICCLCISGMSWVCRLYSRYSDLLAFYISCLTSILKVYYE